MKTKKAWQELKTGKYDWAHQAMEYWPDNRSFAIAHGLDGLYTETAAPRQTKRRRSV